MYVYYSLMSFIGGGKTPLIYFNKACNYFTCLFFKTINLFHKFKKICNVYLINITADCNKNKFINLILVNTCAESIK